METEKIIKYFRLNGHSIVRKISEADFIYIITCAGIQDVEESSIELIKEASKRKREDAQIIIGGCLPKINEKRLSELGEFKTLPPDSIDKLDSIIDSRIKFKTLEDANLLKLDEYIYSRKICLLKEFCGFDVSPASLMKKFDYGFSRLMVLRRHERTRRNLKNIYVIMVSRGCSSQCSYCGIKFAVGKLKSKPLKTIIREFEKGLEQGYRNFIISSEDTGSYGLDINTNIVKLLKELLKHEGNYILTIQTFNPNFLIKYFDKLLPLIKENHKKIKHMSIPIQSGSDRILKLMKRPYKIKKIEKCLLELKKVANNLEISTSLIVGFPGETKEDFEKSIDIIKKINFDAVLFNIYSDRPNTEASKMKNKIPENIKIWRKWKLMLNYYLLSKRHRRYLPRAEQLEIIS